MLIHQLVELGLTEKEARVYLTSMRMGPASMLTLARKSKVDRGTAYHVALTLGDKGLFEQVQTEKGKALYRATHPQYLYDYIRYQLDLAQRRHEIVSTLHRDLEDLYATTSPDS